MKPIRFGNYRIISDRHQYIFQEHKGVTLGKDGEEKDRYEAVGYYRTLSALCRALPDDVIRRSNGNLLEAVSEARQMVAVLEQALTRAGYAIQE